MVIDPPDGRVPYQPWALAKKYEYVPLGPGRPYKGGFDPHLRCFRNAPPRITYAPNGFQILQSPGVIVQLGEYSHNFRVIPTNGTPHIGNDIALFIGDSRGRWEGDTLVVDITNLNGNAWYAATGDFMAPTTTLRESWVLVDNNTIWYEATVTDPTLYTRPWTIGLHLGRRKDPSYELMEFACVEGERNYKGTLQANPSLRTK
jgi:hypothetical protein